MHPASGLGAERPGAGGFAHTPKGRQGTLERVSRRETVKSWAAIAIWVALLGLFAFWYGGKLVDWWEREQRYKHADSEPTLQVGGPMGG